jgi:hypothetical protein
METRARKRGGGAGGGGDATEAGGSSGTRASSGYRSEGPPDDSDADAASELLDPLLEEWRDLLVMHLLARLDPARACGWRSRGWRWCWQTSSRARG